MAEPLPIYEIEADIVSRLKETGRLILSAPTGSGKSTQVPRMLLKHGLLGDGQVVVLQPRRLAARLLATRVAHEEGVQLGKAVGYQIRLENVTSRDTRIRFVTEGILLRQLIDDPELKGVSAILFDEFHERHLYGDITLARALDLQESRLPDLKLIVMSATMDSEFLLDYLSASRAAPAPSVGENILDSKISRFEPPNPLTLPSPPVGERVPEGRVRGNPRAPDRCSVLSSDGRMFPVDIQYATSPSYENRDAIWDQAADAFADFVRSGGKGDALVFMPGGFEIQRTLEAIRCRKEASGYLLLPLHGELTSKDQDAAVARYEKPKVVVATNVAETSLTIDGIRLVIDSGLARIPRYDPYRGINTLLIEKISRASADQRAGRAGRTAPGTCVRLWSAREHEDRLVQEKPEVQRLDLCEVVLTLKAAGVEDLNSFRWLEHPGDKRLQHAVELLVDLGALASPCSAGFQPAQDIQQSQNASRASESNGCQSAPSHRQDACATITELGRRMLAFPLHPRYARMLLAAADYKCVHEACLAAALTQGRDLLVRKVDSHAKHRREDVLGGKSTSDLFLLMKAWSHAAERQFQLEECRKLGIHAQSARQVGPLFQQFLNIAKREGLSIHEEPAREEALQKCILLGFSDRVARRTDAGTLRCELVHGRAGVLARESAVHHAELIVPAEIREVGQGDGSVNTILSLVTAIEESWLREFYPDDFESRVEAYFDTQAKRVYADESHFFRGLKLRSKKVEPPPLEDAARLLADEICSGRLALKDWDHFVEQWIARLNCLAGWCPNLELPMIGDEDRRALVEQICHGEFSFKAVKEKPVKAFVKEWLSPIQRQLLDDHAPERLKLSNGRTPKVIYTAGEAPLISLRIQELYDVTETPRVAMQRVPVLVHILAPNMRPVQVTQDLAGFWTEHYPKLKSQLARRYPKHVWR